MPIPEPVRLRSDGVGPYVIVVPHAPITDGRLSATDLGVYLRCRWLLDVCAPYGDLDWLISELGMPEDETRDSVRRLVELGYVETVGAVEVEFRSAHEMGDGVRAAIEATVDDLTPTERATVARFADLVDQRQAQADEAFTAEQRRDLSGS
uniref:MarR family transcriptional regulator n=1 Tax=Streptomyces sp. NBC_00093 TaxID=2975649 RepID=A0AAU2A7B1_9ACTN